MNNFGAIMRFPSNVAALLTAGLIAFTHSYALAEEERKTEIHFNDIKTKESYVLGFDAGRSMEANITSIKHTNIHIDNDVLIQAFIDGLNNSGQMSPEDAKNTTQAFRKRVSDAMKLAREQDKAEQEQLRGANKLAGQAYLKANKKKVGVITLESGLQYKIIASGNGVSPKATDKVSVHYTGTLVDGSTFDSSRDRGPPSSFGVSRVIKGWIEALQLMREGDHWELTIPAGLAYGATNRPTIPGHSTLIFDLELLKVMPIVKQ
jgi:FKBP-type peptidyl-prolyl cis-trans isomerase FkpA